MERKSSQYYKHSNKNGLESSEKWPKVIAVIQLKIS